MPLINKEMKQICPKCKGTGTSNEVAKTKDGRVIIRDLYTKGDGDKPVYQNCDKCDGEGTVLQPLPTEIVIDGEKRKVTQREAFMHFNPNVVLPEPARS